MKVTAFTKDVLKSRKDRRHNLANGWEFVGEAGGNLWELYRGGRIGYEITDVKISACRMGLWIKTENTLKIKREEERKEGSNE